MPIAAKVNRQKFDNEFAPTNLHHLNMTKVC